MITTGGEIHAIEKVLKWLHYTEEDIDYIVGLYVLTRGKNE